MKISQLSRTVGVTRDTIRHYVDLGLLTPRRDPDNGYQIFDRAALSRLQFIRAARQLGFHLDDIRAIFADAEGDDSPCPRVRELLAQRIADTRRTITELTALCDRMEHTLAEWETMPDSTPNGHSVCKLIESRLDDATE